MNFQSASDALQRIANQQQGIVELAAAIQDLGGLANAKDELTAQVTQLRLDTADATAELLGVKGKVKDHKAFIDHSLEAAQKAADDLTAAAQASAEAIVAQANADAAKIASDAAAAQEAATVAASTQLSTLQGKIDELTAEVAAQEKAKADAEAATADAQAKYDAIKAQIAKLAA